MDLRTPLSLILENSPFLKEAEELRLFSKKDPAERKLRGLKDDEIRKLEERNNHCQDWSLIIVKDQFNADYIRNNRFIGSCILGVFKGTEVAGEDNLSLPSGIYSSIIKNSEIGSGCCIESCGIISNCLVSPESFLFHVNAITAGDELLFANGQKIITGPETGERALSVFAELTPSVLNVISTADHDRETYEKFINAYTTGCSLAFGFIGRGCVIKNTTAVIDSYIADSTVVSGAGIISGSTVLGSEQARTSIERGAEVLNSIIQQGCEISSTAIIHDSLLMEYSQAENQCRICSSIVGPNSSIAGGEVTSSIAGPFTAAHHQSLLIAALWNSGRGNVGYGANVGSNHTSRLPDQEIHPGEGMFFGLGSSIKFPADYRNSPYSIISTGAVTLPQRLEFPFSLISQPSACHENLSPALNELIPAWVLRENIYSVIRNEAKYRKRNRSSLEGMNRDVFRPDTVDLMIKARDRLLSINEEKDCYTDRDIPGTGKNFITEKNRILAAESYDFFIGHYCLRLLALRTGKVMSEYTGPDQDKIFQTDDTTEYWNHAFRLLETEGLSKKSLKENLEDLIKNIRVIEELAHASRQKDFTRGTALIDDYGSFHPLPESDPFICELKEKNEIEIKRIKQIINLI